MGLAARLRKDDGAPTPEDVVITLLILAGMCRWPDFIPILVLASCLLVVLRRVVAGLVAPLPAPLSCGEALNMHRPLQLVAVVVHDAPVL